MEYNIKFAELKSENLQVYLASLHASDTTNLAAYSLSFIY